MFIADLIPGGKVFTCNADWALWSGYIFVLNEQFLFFEASMNAVIALGNP
jgi:hypothetical protein